MQRVKTKREQSDVYFSQRTGRFDLQYCKRLQNSCPKSTFIDILHTENACPTDIGIDNDENHM